MIEKLYMLLICSILEVTKLLISNHHMHNLCAIFVKFHGICKQFAVNLVEAYIYPVCQNAQKNRNCVLATLRPIYAD